MLNRPRARWVPAGRPDTPGCAASRRSGRVVSLHSAPPSPQGADTLDKEATRDRAAGSGRTARDAGVLMAGDLFDRGFGFAFLIAATKLFGLEIYGAYQLALAVFHVVRTVVSFGLGRSLVRDTAAAAATDDMGRVKGAIGLGLAISLSLALTIGAALFVFSPELVSTFYPTHPEAIEPLRVFGLLTPLFAVNFILLQALYGLDRIRLMVIANNVVEPIARLAALLGLYAVGFWTFRALPASYLIALVASSLFAIALFYRQFWPRLASARAIYRVRETLAFTVPVTLNDLATRSFRSLNIFLLAPFFSSTQLGIFSVALKLTSIVFFFSGSLTGAFRPRIARLIAQGRTEELGAETRAYNRWILTFALLPCGLLVLFPEPILNVLGSQYLPVASALRIMVAGLLIAQAAGPLMALLVMSGRTKPPLVFFLVGGSTYTTLALQVVPRYGVEGAAATAVGVILVFVPALSIYVQHALGIRLYGRATWKPLAAGAVAFAAGYAVSLVAPDVRLVDAALIVGTTSAVYAGMLWALGAEPEERALLDELLGSLGKLARKVKRAVA